jgi:choline monooxygenase
MTAEFLLPVRAYTAVEWHAREMERIFGRSWGFAGLASALANPGDYLTVDAGRAAIAVLRGKDNQLRAFHNICRHRGAKLLEGKGNLTGGVKCFYHAWAYGFDGALVGVPQAEQFPGLDKPKLGLKPAALGVFRDMIFVHPDPAAAAAFDSWLGEFPSHFGPFDPSEMTLLYGDTREIAANWKLFVENHIDGYHLYHLHKDSVLGYDHDGQKHMLYGEHWSFFEPWAIPGVLPEFEKRIPGRIVSADDRWKQSSVHMLFPGLCLATGSNWLVLLHVRPVAVDRTCIDLSFFVSGGEKPASTRHFTPPDGRSSEGFDVIAEDAMACERIQAAMASPAFETGPLAKDFERSITQFHRSILNRLAD